MSKRTWAFTITLILLFGCSPLFVFPFWINRQFVDLDRIEGTLKVGQTSDFNLSLGACFGYWSQKQTFHTRNSRSFIWESLQADWAERPGNYLGHINNAIYEDQSIRFLVFKSQVSFLNRPGENEITHAKQVVLHLPPVACSLSGNQRAR